MVAAARARCYDSCRYKGFTFARDDTTALLRSDGIAIHFNDVSGGLRAGPLMGRA